MKTASKNHTISQMVAKTILRLILVLLAFPLIIYFSKPELFTSDIAFSSTWAMVAPILLVLLYVVFLIIVLQNKFTKIDVNWLFSLTGFFLGLYLILLYSRILPHL